MLGLQQTQCLPLRTACGWEGWAPVLLQQWQTGHPCNNWNRLNYSGKFWWGFTLVTWPCTLMMVSQKIDKFFILLIPNERYNETLTHGSTGDLYSSVRKLASVSRNFLSPTSGPYWNNQWALSSSYVYLCMWAHNMLIFNRSECTICGHLHIVCQKIAIGTYVFILATSKSDHVADKMICDFNHRSKAKLLLW